MNVLTDLPDRIVVGANGAYWRDFGEFYSMCPVSTDNDPVDVVAVYVRVQPPVTDPNDGADIRAQTSGS